MVGFRRLSRIKVEAIKSGRRARGGMSGEQRKEGEKEEAGGALKDRRRT